MTVKHERQNLMVVKIAYLWELMLPSNSAQDLLEENTDATATVRIFFIHSKSFTQKHTGFV